MKERIKKAEKVWKVISGTIGLAKLWLCVGMLLIFSAQSVFADADHGQYATSGDMAEVKEVEKYGMTPIAGSLLKEGTWSIDVSSSSSFFIVEKCELTIDASGEMTARMTMYSSSYELLYMGSAEEAAAADAAEYIEYQDVDDWCVFTIPVKALNQKIACAAYSKRKEKWYDRDILFDAASLDEEALNGIELPDYDLIEEALEEGGGLSDRDLTEENGKESGEDSDAAGAVSDENAGTVAEDIAAEATAGKSRENQEENSAGKNVTASAEASYDLPAEDNVPMELDLEDGRYSIELAMSGGSGRASISTPTLMIVEDGKAYARLLWSSSHYDWMQVGDQVYENETTDGGNSTFTIPISDFDRVITVIADTTAMGAPTAIEYSVTFYRETIGDEGLIPQEAAKKVVVIAAIIIVGGFFLNMYVKKRRKG